MGVLKVWAAPACNNPVFAEIVPPHLRNLIYAFDRCFEGAVAACATPFVGLLAEKIFGFTVRTHSGLEAPVPPPSLRYWLKRFLVLRCAITHAVCGRTSPVPPPLLGFWLKTFWFHGAQMLILFVLGCPCAVPFVGLLAEQIFGFKVYHNSKMLRLQMTEQTFSVLVRDHSYCCGLESHPVPFLCQSASRKRCLDLCCV